MRLGAMFPTTEIGEDPGAVRDWAQAVEDLGFDHITTYGHVIGFRGGDYIGPTTVFHEPLTLFAFLVAVTPTGRAGHRDPCRSDAPDGPPGETGR